jgi:hypothetical protein
MAQYSGDPRWMRVKYPSQCRQCGKQICRGDEALYYPKSKTLLCAGENCGKKASRDFEAAKFDESVMSGAF